MKGARCDVRPDNSAFGDLRACYAACLSCCYRRAGHLPEGGSSGVEAGFPRCFGNGVVVDRPGVIAEYFSPAPDELLFGTAAHEGRHVGDLEEVTLPHRRSDLEQAGHRNAGEVNPY